eukprot:13814093-Heterocapsa_arctica.AAC.1
MGAIRHNLVVDPELVKIIEKGSRKIQPRLIQLLSPTQPTCRIEAYVADKLGRWYPPFAAS